MQKKAIAVIFGGESSEYEVSLKSACSVIENLDTEKYNIIKIGITIDGKWFRYSGEVENIKNNTWFLDKSCTKVIISPSKGDREIIEIKNHTLIHTKIDIVFPVLHGKNGEDGTLQGLLEIVGIPYVGCNVATSSICMDKDYAHKIVSNAGFNVPRSIAIYKEIDIEDIYNFAMEVGFPVYVKPSKEGSSIGMSKAKDNNELLQGIEKALEFDDKVVLEENIDGFEVGCAILGNKDLIVGTVDEIEVYSYFFDFKEKYTLEHSKIHLPARIDSYLSDKIKEIAKEIYNILGCSGLSRVDMFVGKDKRIVFNEVNTLPGFTTGSRFPNMLLYSGMQYKDILDKLIDLTVER